MAVLFVWVYFIGHLISSSNGLLADAMVAGTRGILPRFLQLGPEILSLLILAFTRRRNQRSSRSYQGLILWLFVWWGIIMLSDILGAFSGELSLLAIFASWRYYFRIFIPFLIGMSLVERDDILWVLRVMLIIGFIQVPLAIIQSLYAPTPDFVTGLMGRAGSGNLAVFQIVCFGILLSRYLNFKGNRRFKFNSRLWLLISRVVIPGVILLYILIMAQVIAGFIMLIVLAIAIMRFRFISTRGIALTLIIVVILIAGNSLYPEYFEHSSLYEKYTPSGVKDFLLAGQGNSKLIGGSTVGRLQVFVEFNRFLSSRGNVWLGNGPGVFSNSLLLSTRSSAFRMLWESVIGSLSLGSLLLIETGYIGLLWWVVFLLMILKSWVISYKLAGDTRDVRYILDVFLGFYILIIVSIIYNQSLAVPTIYFPFMLMAGFVVKTSQEARTHDFPKLDENLSQKIRV